MQAKLINEKPVTYAVVFETGEEVVEGLVRLAKELNLTASHLSAIGAFSEVVLGHFNLEKKDYKRIPVVEQVEALSILGDIAMKDGEPQLHAHAVVGKSDASVLGGHLISGTVRPTLEVILTESPHHLSRSFNPGIGLALLDLDK